MCHISHARDSVFTGRGGQRALWQALEQLHGVEWPSKNTCEVEAGGKGNSNHEAGSQDNEYDEERFVDAGEQDEQLESEEEAAEHHSHTTLNSMRPRFARLSQQIMWEVLQDMESFECMVTW